MAPAPSESTVLPLLKKLATARSSIAPSEVTDALSLVFLGQVSAVQTGALLTSLHYTGLDCSPPIIAAAASAMRNAGLRIQGLPVPAPPATASTPTPSGCYSGGLVEIAGTGGDGHDTFNVSTSAAMLAAGCGVRICKHGNRASTSASGSADLLVALGAALTAVTPATAAGLLARSRFCFVFAPVFHPAVAHVAPIRRQLGCRTIFNLLGPLAHPVDATVGGYGAGAGAGVGLEARIVGVGRSELGPVFADVLRLLGVQHALVVCGAEELDEVSCSGDTLCWRLSPTSTSTTTASRTATISPDEIEITHFRVHPTHTFGLETHALSTVAGGKAPAHNAAILEQLLLGRVPRGDPIRDFVVANTAALLVIADFVDGDEVIGDDGVMRGSKWTNAVRVCEETLQSGEAWTQWVAFAQGTREAETRIAKEKEVVA